MNKVTLLFKVIRMYPLKTEILKNSFNSYESKNIKIFSEYIYRQLKYHQHRI